MKSKYRVIRTVVELSIKWKAVPNMIYHLGVRNSYPKMKPTMTRPLFIAPQTNIIAIVREID